MTQLLVKASVFLLEITTNIFITVLIQAIVCVNKKISVIARKKMMVGLPTL
jgi:hypothetical protein